MGTPIDPPHATRQRSVDYQVHQRPRSSPPSVSHHPLSQMSFPPACVLSGFVLVCEASTSPLPSSLPQTTALVSRYAPPTPFLSTLSSQPCLIEATHYTRCSHRPSVLLSKTLVPYGPGGALVVPSLRCNRPRRRIAKNTKLSQGTTIPPLVSSPMDQTAEPLIDAQPHIPLHRSANATFLILSPSCLCVDNPNRICRLS